MQSFEEEYVRALFRVADLQVLKMWQLANQYYGRVDPQANVNSPWWLVKTHLGLIELGRRKRVVSINWEETQIRAIVTRDDVTKTVTMVHAWTDMKVIEYLSMLSEIFRRNKLGENTTE